MVGRKLGKLFDAWHSSSGLEKAAHRAVNKNSGLGCESGEGKFIPRGSKELAGEKKLINGKSRPVKREEDHYLLSDDALESLSNWILTMQLGQ